MLGVEFRRLVDGSIADYWRKMSEAVQLLHILDDGAIDVDPARALKRLLTFNMSVHSRMLGKTLKYDMRVIDHA